jgi:hypothetical protein
MGPGLMLSEVDSLNPNSKLSSIEGLFGFNKPHSEMTDNERLEVDRRLDEAVAKALAENVV